MPGAWTISGKPEAKPGTWTVSGKPESTAESRGKENPCGPQTWIYMPTCKAIRIGLAEAIGIHTMLSLLGFRLTLVPFLLSVSPLLAFVT